MTQLEIQQSVKQDEEISLKELALKIKEWVIYLKSKWLVIFLAGVFGAGIGLAYAYRQEPVYTAILTFALEDEKSGTGLSGAMGLASSLGIDLGTSAGGAFSGANLIELMRSRTLVEKALLNPITVSNKKQSLASYFIEFKQLNKDWNNNPEVKNIKFEPFADRSTYTLQQDSILGNLYGAIAGPDGILSVSQKDKKISIINVEVKSTNELFSKVFTESIAKEVSEFYIETKSKKAKLNVAILQRQADSIRRELNAAITGVAVANDNTYNLNPALINELSLLTFSFFNGKIGLSITCINGVSLRRVTLAISKLATNCDKIAELACTSICFLAEEVRFMLSAGFIGGFLVTFGLIGTRFFRKKLFDNI